MDSGEENAIMSAQHRGFAMAAGICVLLSAVYSGVYLGRATADRPDVVEERVNPNTADAASLVRLPNIGPSRAEAIIAYRRGAASASPVFEKPEDLEKVKGIGPKTVERMRPWLRFDE